MVLIKPRKGALTALFLTALPPLMNRYHRESVPVDKGKDNEIIGGSINGEGILKFKVNRVGDKTFFPRSSNGQEAQESRSNTQRLADVGQNGFSILQRQPAPLRLLCGWLDKDS